MNKALVDLPDNWTENISWFMLKYRTSRYVAFADIKLMYYHLHLDLSTVNMTRIHWRRSGLGSKDPLEDVLVLVGTIGLKPLKAIASHVRVRTSQMIKHDPSVRS